MKILKKILVVIACIIAIPLVIALFIKNEYAVERKITVNKPRQEVFEYIKFQKNQDNYNIWIMKDPNIKKRFSGTDGAVGFVYTWEGNDEVGKGEQEIMEINENENILLEIRFIEPFEGIGNVHLATSALTDNQTEVTWGMEGKNPYPLNLMNLFIGNMLGKDLETSLTRLKNILEGQ